MKVAEGQICANQTSLGYEMLIKEVSTNLAQKCAGEAVHQSCQRCCRLKGLLQCDDPLNGSRIYERIPVAIVEMLDISL